MAVRRGRDMNLNWKDGMTARKGSFLIQAIVTDLAQKKYHRNWIKISESNFLDTNSKHHNSRTTIS